MKAKRSTKEHAFTVNYEPIEGGFQVTVPSLVGLVTFGRTFDEAREMARDAIKCHVEALQKDRVRVPSEMSLFQERMLITV